MLTLFPAHYRSKDLDFRTLRKSKGLVHHICNGLLLHRPPTLRTVGFADACKQQTQIVIDLGHRSYSRPRIAASRLLVDRNSRGKPLNIIHIWLISNPQKLAGIGGKRLHIAPLALCINGIESQ
jgi:hypothetical protein